MILLISIATFICITLTVIGISALFFGRTKKIVERLKPKPKKKETTEIDVDKMAALAERIARPLNRIAPPSTAEANKLQKQLMQAGYYSQRAPMIYRALQQISMLGLPGVTALLLFLFAWPFNQVLLGSLMAFIVGFFVPRRVLGYLINRRQERLRWGLADALDLMVVSMEAGLGMNASMVRVSEELREAHPEISEEFEMVNLEIRVGRERVEALRNLSERTGVEDLTSFVAMLIQADRFGTSIGRAVRVYSESLRTKRRQRAEQEAQKAAVKLLFPLTCFLFPTLFIVILGPAFISIMDAFAGM